MCDRLLSVPKFGQPLSAKYPPHVCSDSDNSFPGRKSKNEEEKLDTKMEKNSIDEENSIDWDSDKMSQKGRRTRRNSRKGNSWRQSNRTRRLVANARERSRIHIMSEAFEGLRRAVPCYSYDQKLSKLAILRIATSYIDALANLTETDTSDKSLQRFAESVDQCTKALQSEGRSRRKTK